MADSDDSRTLPSVNLGKNEPTGNEKKRLRKMPGKNLFLVVTDLLTSGAAKIHDQPGGHGSPSISPVLLWQDWFLLHQRREQITKLQQELEGQVLAAAGGFPIVAITVPSQEKPTIVHCLAEIERLSDQLNAEQLINARSELRRRRKKWRDADRDLGFSAALALEYELSLKERKLARSMAMAKPGSLIDVIAKLHCLIAMEDPWTKHKETPWPQLRTILGDLAYIERITKMGCTQ